jgi:GDPmannose 4,6-dehydratase
VDAIYRMMQLPQPEDFVIATGESHSLEEFIARVFGLLGLDWKRHVESDPELLRPSDILISRGNPARAREVLGWQARHKMADVARMMVEARRGAGK